MASKQTAAKASRKAQDVGMVSRLTDQLKVFKKAQKIHANISKLNQIAFYPAHDKRRETPGYKKIHKHLTVELDLPCLICGVKHSTLKDPGQNPYGAKQMETHHHIVEWALANAISTEKFNSRVLPHLAHRHGDKPEYKKPFTDQQVKDWVDHSPDNLWVLCDVHHRAKYMGIHEITFPIWGPANLLRDDFEEYVMKEIAKAKAANKKRSPAKKKKTRTPKAP